MRGRGAESVLSTLFYISRSFLLPLFLHVSIFFWRDTILLFEGTDNIGLMEIQRIRHLLQRNTPVKILQQIAHQTIINVHGEDWVKN